MSTSILILILSVILFFYFIIFISLSGIVLSGNEISQILLSLILSYVGGQRNRPLWIAWGMVFCGLSCFILALPHLLYGLGDDAFHLTKEYFDIVGTKAHVILGVSNTNHPSPFSIYFIPGKAALPAYFN